MKIGFIGGGMMSQVAHLPFYLRDPRCEVVGVAESRPSLVQNLIDSFGIKHIPLDHREILDDQEISTVVIVAPRPAQGPLVLEALNAGKNVIVEKPSAHTSEQARRQIDVANAKNLNFSVGFMKRYDAGVQAAKTHFDGLMNSQRLGRLLFVRFFNFANSYAHTIPPHKRPSENRKSRFHEWPLVPKWLPDELCESYAWFMNSAIHDINLMHYFLPQGLQVRGAHIMGNGSLIANLSLDQSSVVYELVKCETGSWQQGTEFLFEKGRMALNIPSPMAIDRVTRVTVEENTDNPQSRELSVPVEWCFESQAKAFIDDFSVGRRSLANGWGSIDDLILTEDIWKFICSIKK